jgi:oxalate decarboxylase/phosphoglucose isomerase-like protein (cupin superfamily)
MPGKFTIARDVPPDELDWGQLRWLSHPPSTGARQLTVIDVTLAPGKGHDFHKHPDQEEVILILGGNTTFSVLLHTGCTPNPSIWRNTRCTASRCPHWLTR